MFELSKEQLLEIAKCDTPSLANALEILCGRSRLEGFNKEETRDFMPHMGTMVGYAVTFKVCASRPSTAEEDLVFKKTLRLIEGFPKPIIMVMKDIDSPNKIVGSMWGRVTAITYKAMGVVGVIADGAVRDLPSMIDAGFHAIARRVCVSHGYAHHIASGEPVQVFGTEVKTGDLIAADQHGFITIPYDCASRVAEVANIIDKLERENLTDLTEKHGYNVDMRLKGFEIFQEKMSEIKDSCKKV